MVAGTVYLLCAFTSIACAIVLLRAYSQNRMALLLWSGLCFVGLALNNSMLFIDLILLPSSIDLSIPRGITGLVALCLLIYGLVWEIK